MGLRISLSFEKTGSKLSAIIKINIFKKITVYNSSKEKETSKDEIAKNLDISIDEIDMIINKVKRNAHKSKVPESPEKTVMVI